MNVSVLPEVRTSPVAISVSEKTTLAEYVEADDFLTRGDANAILNRLDFVKQPQARRVRATQTQFQLFDQVKFVAIVGWINCDRDAQIRSSAARRKRRCVAAPGQGRESQKNEAAIWLR